MKENVSEIERIFMALSDNTRIRLVGLMADGEVSVNYLCESLGESQPKVSRHLAYLRSMGMVNTRREGKWIYYSLSEPESRIGSGLFNDMIAWIASATRGRYGAEGRPFQMPPSGSGESDIGKASFEDSHARADTYSESNELEIYLL